MNRKIVGLIDNDVVYQSILKHFAEKHKDVKQVLQFYDGEEGINYFKENKEVSSVLPQLILLDINMPYMDGWQFIDELATLNVKNYLPVIFIISSSTNKSDIEKAKHYSQVTGYHVKPVKREHFDAFMASITANSD